MFSDLVQELMREPDELWIVFSFIVFLLVIWFKGRKAILSNLDKRIEIIRKEIDTAQALRHEAQALVADYEAKHSAALKEAETVVATAERHAAELRRQGEYNLNEMMALREKQLKDRIETMKQTAMDDIQRYAADLAIKATAGIITEKLDETAKTRLADQAIREIGGKIH
jgi:F-type H+-transporting ATPase subunit b